MNRREYLMLAQKYKPGKSKVGGWYISEKLDGMRCFWDGGISTGRPKSEIPWANTAKDARYREAPICTGLWSRYGNVIHCPTWFLHNLPMGVCLDGELWAGRSNSQFLFSTVKDITPNNDHWQRVTYRIFDMVCYPYFFKDGFTTTPNCTVKICESDCIAFAERVLGRKIDKTWYSFLTTYGWLIRNIPDSEYHRVHTQYTLPFLRSEYEPVIEQMLNEIVSKGGEGVMFREPNSLWMPDRGSSLLKYKPFEDSEAIIVGYVTGKETDKGSRLLGMVGALVVNWNGKIFELSGMTDSERSLSGEVTLWAISNPGQTLPLTMEADYFKRGQVVNFKYRELTDAGIPKEARYNRIRSND